MMQLSPIVIVFWLAFSVSVQYEYLGMLLDDKLSMNEYADAVWKKTNAKVGILATIRRFILENTAAKIYKTID